MSDRRRIVTLDAAGTATTIKDLEDSTVYFAVRDSFEIKPPEAHTIAAAMPRRWGGSRAAGETHDNGEVSWKLLVKGSTADVCLQNVEAAIGSVITARTDLHLEWRPDGATNSTFFEIRGPAKFTPTYQWAQFAGAQSMLVDVAVPVAPLPRGVPTPYTIASTTMPAVVALNAVPGDAPALADVTLRATGGTAPPIWAMLAWTKRPGTPLAASVAPFGIIEAESGALTGMVSTASALARGGTFAQVTATGAGTASALYAVDPSVMQPDDFTSGEVDIEVWARVLLDSALVSPRATLSLQPFAGLAYGAEQFSAEHGASGKVLTKPSAGQVWRPVKLGTLTMPVETGAPLKWNVKVALSRAAGSSGLTGLDYLVMVPARQRALSPTAKANDVFYPDFIASTADTTKTIRSDLSGRVASAAGNQGRDTGLGGSLLELPTGNVDLLVLLSSVVPDDPTIDATAMQLAHTGVTGQVLVTPRYWLARGV